MDVITYLNWMLVHLYMYLLVKEVWNDRLNVIAVELLDVDLKVSKLGTYFFL